MECSICGGTKYTDALKKYNQGKPEWCMPRKGTPGHTEILNIIAKPKRKLGQKRILDSAPSKESIVEEKKNMETPKRKLRSVKERENSKLMAMEDKDAPEIEVVKNGKKWYEYKYWTDGEFNYELNPTIRDGNTRFFNLLEEDQEKIKKKHGYSWTGISVRNTKDDSPPKQLKNRNLRPQLKEEMEEYKVVVPYKPRPKGEWYEHKYWMIDDGTTRELYEIDPVIRPGNKYYFKRMLTAKQKEKIGTHPRNFGFTIRITKKGLPHEADFPENMRPI